MDTALADNSKSWKTKQEHPTALQVALLKRAYVLPWVQFLYAEGDNDQIHIAFSTHDVVIKGAGLQSLLSDVAAQRIAQVQEPARYDQFQNDGAPYIREISVAKIEERPE